MIRGTVPEAYADLVVYVTDLGGTSTLMVVLALCYWLSDRRASAAVISYAVAGLAFLVALKAALAVPRPPSEVWMTSYDASGYGFPSGHAFAATLVYGGILLRFEFDRQRAVTLAVAALVALVSLSRVVLGVHYLGDVVAGIGLAVAFAFGMERLVGDDPRRGFVVGTLLAVPALVVTGGGENALLALGGAVGGLVGSTRLEALPALRSKLEGAVLATTGGVAIVVLEAAESLVATVEPALVALYAVLFATILLVPVPIARLGGPLDARTAS